MAFTCHLFFKVYPSLGNREEQGFLPQSQDCGEEDRTCTRAFMRAQLWFPYSASLRARSQLSFWSLWYMGENQPPPQNSVSLIAQAQKLRSQPNLDKRVSSQRVPSLGLTLSSHFHPQFCSRRSTPATRPPLPALCPAYLWMRTRSPSPVSWVLRVASASHHCLGTFWYPWQPHQV